MGLFSQSSESTFPWVSIQSLETWKGLIESDKTFVVFKHSTRCSISSFALKNFEREFQPTEGVGLYFLDLISFRSISNQIAIDTDIEHQSPQVLVIRSGNVIYNASHHSIDAKTIQNLLA